MSPEGLQFYKVFNAFYVPRTCLRVVAAFKVTKPEEFKFFLLNYDRNVPHEADLSPIDLGSKIHLSLGCL